MKIIMSLWISSAFAFGSHVFEFHLRQMPKDFRDCRVVATEAAETFFAKTKLPVVEAFCRSESKTSYNIQINYLSDTALNVVSTFYELPGIDDQRYKDLETCERNLPIQLAIFERATGLNHLFSYCAPSDYKDYSPAIIAVGNPLRLPQADHYALFTEPKYIAQDKYISGLKHALASRDAVLGEVVVSPSITFYMVTIHYFAKERIDFGNSVVSQIHGKQVQCEEQANETVVFLQGVSVGPFLVYCSYLSLMDVWELNFVTAGELSFQWRASIEKFSSYTGCRENQGSVVSKYQKYEKGIRGGVCSFDLESNKYFVNLFKDVAVLW